ncbi:MAG: DUF1013 domain-containing protein [Alphaproteobacteria bacterium]|nr:DUF1013 domain-containing protein [Alphaproteobacteria bacterium]
MAQHMPLMPKATAVWLVDNTTLSFEQIADFCGLHALEVQAIADAEVAVGMVGMNPVVAGQLTDEEIKRCENDTRAKLKILRSDLPQPVARSKGPRYTPVTKRADKPDGIAFLLKTYPDLQDAQIARLIGTTKDTINKIRDRTHWNASQIKPRDPVLIGLCKRSDLEAAIKKAERRIKRQEKEAAKAARLAAQQAGGEEDAQTAEPEDAPMPLAADNPGTDETDEQSPFAEDAPGKDFTLPGETVTEQN